MNKVHIEFFASAFLATEANQIPKDVARVASLAGTALFSEPLFAYGSADNEDLLQLKNHPEASVSLMPPREWLPEAETVICCFLPLSEAIRASNRKGPDVSWGWLHGRIEGQALLERLALQICELLQQAGYAALVPALDERFIETRGTPPDGVLFANNWSERHVGYCCGLGTLSLSKGLITKKGVAGRIFSIVTSLKLQPTVREYSGLVDYCINCGACRIKCPVGAINKMHDKDEIRCMEKLNLVRRSGLPYYGCGKCQVAVPCEAGIPRRRSGAGA
ncbi:MAG: 4Fe-4S binding protein [Coriobacteriales bacterium]|jgi:epoxyqueuosine reductase QueG|nr:4Fe-4S binding protein [Coriobacteriales bacterium]